MDNNYLRAVSAMEQAAANLSPFASLLHTYHKSLCEAGFQRSEALQLVRELQTTLFTQAFNFGPTVEPDED